MSGKKEILDESIVVPAGVKRGCRSAAAITPVSADDSHLAAPAAVAIARPRRKKKTPDAARQVFADGAALAAQTLVELLNHTGGDVRLRAANSILDRALGKPEQGHKMEAEGSSATAVVVVRAGGGDDGPGSHFPGNDDVG